MLKYMTPPAILSEEPHGPFLPGGNLFYYKYKYEAINKQVLSTNGILHNKVCG